METNLVTPKPYWCAHFNTSNRLFRNVIHELYEIGESIGIDPNDGYFTEQCDYEGDLEKVIIYRNERGEEFVKAIAKHFDFELSEDKSLNVVLSLF